MIYLTDPITLQSYRKCFPITVFLDILYIIIYCHKFNISSHDNIIVLL